MRLPSLKEAPGSGGNGGIDVVTGKFWRLTPVGEAAGSASAEQTTLAAPRELISRLSRHDGIVVASWDEARDQGRVHALGVVRNVDKVASVAIVDWRRANFTVNPSAQGRAQWVNRPFFKFADGPAAKYGLAGHFARAFSAADDAPSDPTKRQAGEPAAAAGSKAAPVGRSVSSRAVVTPRSNSSSPQRNRVAPDGTVIATSARGTFMGNRAYGARWLVCDLDFERDLAAPRRYEKLFFLDEAVALSAGHRPCLTCRRDRFTAYVAAVQRSIAKSRASEIDDALKTARSAPRRTASVRSLPDGVFVALGSADFHLVWDGALHRWTPQGYTDRMALTDTAVDDVAVLTPAPSVAALQNGYRVDVHSSVALR